MDFFDGDKFYYLLLWAGGFLTGLGLAMILFG